MGTHGLVHIRTSEKSKDLVCLYRQFDGYPSGMGEDIRAIVSGYRITNGIGMDDKKCAKCGVNDYLHKDESKNCVFESKRVANGIECLGATLIKGLKDGIGNLYLAMPNTKEAGDEYQYFVWQDKGKVMLKVVKSGHEAFGEYPAVEPVVLYRGHVDEFNSEVAEKVA